MKKQIISWWEDSSGDPGYNYLISNAKAFYDFTALTGNVGDTVPATWEDLSTNNRDLTRSNSPTVNTLTVDGNTFKGINTNGTAEAYLMPGNEAAVFGSSFEFWAVFRMSDGIPSANTLLFGAYYPTGGSDTIWQVLVNSSGNLQFGYFTAGVGYAWRTNSARPNLETGQIIVRISLDFETDTVKTEVDGITAAITNVAGTGISLINPASWHASTPPFGIGSVNNNGTVTNMAQEITICRVAVTPLLTDLQASQVFDYLDLGV